MVVVGWGQGAGCLGGGGKHRQWLVASHCESVRLRQYVRSPISAHNRLPYNRQRAALVVALPCLCNFPTPTKPGVDKLGN